LEGERIVKGVGKGNGEKKNGGKLNEKKMLVPSAPSLAKSQ